MYFILYSNYKNIGYVLRGIKTISRPRKIEICFKINLMAIHKNSKQKTRNRGAREESWNKSYLPFIVIFSQNDYYK